MRRTVFFCLAALLIMFVGCGQAPAIEINPLILGEIQFPAPDSSADRKYLGISANPTFTLPQIKADLVIVEIFDTYCPVCQIAAPDINRLCDIIERNPDWKSQVRLIGIGMGNSPLEVKQFRKKYDVKFPLFPDDLFRLHKAIFHTIKTPTFLALTKKDHKRIIVSNVYIGRIDDTDEFIKEMIVGELKAK
jgi:thiol-disulfide isomerase/thioredoxin